MGKKDKKSDVPMRVDEKTVSVGYDGAEIEEVYTAEGVVGKDPLYPVGMTGGNPIGGIPSSGDKNNVDGSGFMRNQFSSEAENYIKSENVFLSDVNEVGNEKYGEFDEKKNFPNSQKNDEKIKIAEEKREEKERLVKEKEETKLAKEHEKIREKIAKEEKRNAERAEMKARAERERAGKRKEILEEAVLEDNYHIGEHRRDRGGRGFKIATLVLAIVAAALTATTALFVSSTITYKTRSDNAYNKAYYQFVNDINKLESTLSKSFVSADKDALMQNLNSASALALSAESNFSAMPAYQSEAYKITRFFNRVMDYTKSLSQKASSGVALSAEERESLKGIYNINVKLKKAVNDAYEKKSKSGDLFNFGKYLSGKIPNDFDGMYSLVSEDTIKMPTLIYDGPFSDSKDGAESKEREIKVSAEKAEMFAKKILKGQEEFSYRGELKNKGVLVYSFTARKEDREFSLQIDSGSGLPVLMNAYRAVTSDGFDEKRAIERAEDALEYLGYEDVEEVWQITQNNVMTINFAFEEDDVIFYNRLVKVKIALDNGEILGIEGINYAKNSDAAPQQKAVISEKEARSKVAKELRISSSRLTVIPKNENVVLAYEFAGSYEGLDFFVYIDATTGKQVNILRVVDNEQGRLLM